MLQVDGGFNKRLKPAVLMALVNERHHFAALSQSASGEELYNWQSEGLQMCLVICKDSQPMTAHEMVIYGGYRNTLSGRVLSYSKFLDGLKTMLTCAKVHELEYDFLFIKVKSEYIGADLIISNFLAGASLATCKKYVRVAKRMLQFLDAPKTCSG